MQGREVYFGFGRLKLSKRKLSYKKLKVLNILEQKDATKSCIKIKLIFLEYVMPMLYYNS